MSKMTKQQKDHHANQKNPNSAANKAARDNTSRQLNPKDVKYYESRGIEPPADLGKPQKPKK